MGIQMEKPTQVSLFAHMNFSQFSFAAVDDIATGFLNNPIALTDAQLLLNVRNMQARNNIRQTDSLVKHLGKCSLDIEMETGTGINVMIINIQAFNARGADARRIYEELDDFGTRKPIDVIAANRPIVILDEPQKMGGEKTQLALKEFNPLFCLNYSATHKQHHDLVYVLDAMDAYNKRLVKRIEVKGFDVKNFRGTDRYLFLENIIVTANKPPMARLELKIKYNKSINRESRLIRMDDPRAGRKLFAGLGYRFSRWHGKAYLFHCGDKGNHGQPKPQAH